MTNTQQTPRELRHPVFAGVVFDCDGLLADTTSTWSQAFHQTALAFAFKLSPAQLSVLHGSAIEPAATRLAVWSGTSDVGGVTRRLHEELRTAIEARPPQPMPGATELLAALTLPRAVASNAPNDVLLKVLQGTGLRHYVQVTVTPTDRLKPKPAPDLYAQACRALGLAPTSAVALEDSLTGAKAAHAAGLAVVAVTTTPWLAAELPVLMSVPDLKQAVLWELIAPSVSTSVQQ